MGVVPSTMESLGAYLFTGAFHFFWGGKTFRVDRYYAAERSRTTACHCLDHPNFADSALDADCRVARAESDQSLPKNRVEPTDLGGFFQAFLGELPTWVNNQFNRFGLTNFAVMHERLSAALVQGSKYLERKPSFQRSMRFLRRFHGNNW